MRNLDKAGNTLLRGNARNSGGAINVHTVEVEVPAVRRILGVHSLLWATNALGLVVPADEVVDNVRMPQALCNLRLVPDIPFLRGRFQSSNLHQRGTQGTRHGNDLAKVAHWLQVAHRVLLAVRYNNLRPGFGCFRGLVSG